MKVPVSWLKEFVDVTMPIKELAERLTLAGLEVGSIEYFGVEGSDLPWDREKIVVAQVMAVHQHPNADRLVLAEVDYGGGEKETLVTGAPNLFQYIGKETGSLNLKSPMAFEGVTLYDGHKEGRVKMRLKGREVRGIMNRHMLCSEKELGISDDHEGIIILDPDAPVGMPLADYLGDVVLDIDLTPNIARCASIIGVAREVAALTGQKVRYPSLEVEMEGRDFSGKLVLEAEDPELNQRFCAALIEDITIKPSPYCMQIRLRRAGMRPINNIVDVSNYVMLETGQPTHAFDYDFLRRRADEYDPGGPVRIITRLAEPGEKIITLDNVERKLEPYNLMVTDPKGSLSVAGVMGGLESEVEEDTTNILLESANWNLIGTRRTIAALKLLSEASYRFSRGVHPATAMVGLLRSVELMRQLADGKVAKGIVDYYPLPAETIVVDFGTRDVSRILGIELGLDEIRRILEGLEFTCEPLDDSTLRVTAPDHRMDIGTGTTGVHDLAEEVARIYGYDRIPVTNLSDTLPPQRGNTRLVRSERVRDLLVYAGLQEIVTYRLTTPEAERRVNVPQDAPYVRLANPISADRVVMRRTLLNGVLEIVSNNARYRDRIGVFEVGEVFLPHPAGAKVLPEEPARLCIAITGPREPESWKGADTSPVDFYDLKGVVDSLLEGMHLGEATYEPAAHDAMHPGRTARVSIGGQQLGFIGELHPLVHERYDLPPTPVLVGDFDLEAVFALVESAYKVRSVPRFPPVVQDIAVVVDEGVPAAEVEGVIRGAGGFLLADVRLFDLYRGEQIGGGKKSLAYSLTFQAPDKTLTDGQVAKLQDKIVKQLEKSLGAKLRS